MNALHRSICPHDEHFDDIPDLTSESIKDLVSLLGYDIAIRPQIKKKQRSGKY